MSISEGLSFRSIENRYFNEFCQKLSQYNIDYKLPKRKAVLKEVNRLAIRKKTSITNELSNKAAVAITTDCWTSKNQKLGYIGITAHYFDQFILKTVCLGVKQLHGSHTAPYLAQVLTDVFEEHNIRDKITGLMGDNAATMPATARELNIPFYGCLAHTLNLIIVNFMKDYVDNDGDLSVLLQKCRSLVGLFSHSVKMTEQLREDQPSTRLPNGKMSHPKTLFRDVSTR
jgi:hypothetical protein